MARKKQKYCERKNYKTGDWYEIEQKEYIKELNYDPITNKYEKFDINDADFLTRIRMGLYRGFFEDAERVLKRKPTVYDYHNLYVRILEELRIDIITDNMMDQIALPEEELSISYNDIIFAFEKEKKKLDRIFDEFASKIEKPVNLLADDFFEDVKKKLNNFIPEKNTITELTDWQRHLITVKGFLYEDGKRVNAKLPLVIEELVDFTKKTYSWRWIQEHFLRSDGRSFSYSACTKARDYANTR